MSLCTRKDLNDFEIVVASQHPGTNSKIMPLCACEEVNDFEIVVASQHPGANSKICV